MKKTLTVNISGIVFHIDEDAYHVLNDYLQSIRKHFSKTEGRDEIISDIEARIAEMLKERIGDERQVITIDDIEEVIRVIGLPEEFGESFAGEETGDSAGSYQKATKRLYRDPENAILGGVCGGLGAYFHTDPVWFRIAFVLLCIPGVGTPLLVYVILWIVIPEAKTAAERLEMKGEPVNISNIEKSIREEISNLKNKFNEFTREAKRTYKKKSAAHRSDLQGVENAVSRIALLFARVILIFAGFILSVIGISLLLGILVLIFGFGMDFFVFDSEVINISLLKLSEIFVGPPANSIILQISLLLTIGIPIAMLLYAGIKLMLGLNRTRHVGTTAFYVWLVSLIICIFYGVNIFRDFNHEGRIIETTQIDIPGTHALDISAGDNREFERIYRYGDYIDIDETNFILANDKDNMLFGIPKLKFEQSNNNKAEVELIYRARGKSEFHADERAKQTLYHYTIANGSIVLDPCFTLSEGEVWRKQEVEIALILPVGTILRINKNLRPIIDDRRYSSYRLAGDTWIMTNHGLENYEGNIIIPEKEPEQPESTPEPKEEKKDSLVFNLTKNIIDIVSVAIPGI